MRLDYQNTQAAMPGEGRVGSLFQHYYLRAMDRLFVKNLLVFSGNVSYRTGNESGQPVDFRPRYELQLTSAGYGARAGYEPYTLRRGGSSLNQENRRWRASIYAQPARWPRFTYDMSRIRQEHESEDVSHNDWNSYAAQWQPGSQVLATSYTRQVRTSPDSLSETLETYRGSAATDIPLPADGRLALSYNYDRTWRRRSQVESGALDQHVPTANLSSQPAQWMAWTAQYTGRYIIEQENNAGNQYFNDQLANGALNLMPARGWSFGLIRYYEKTESRDGQDVENTDYWQVRASNERVFFRQIRSQFTVYRIAYADANEGERYSDAYFASLRGRPHRHAELSTEAGLADRHGLQTRRFAVNMNSFLRLFPTHGSQAQVGYNAIAEGFDLDNLSISEESVTSSLQYSPDTRISVSGGATSRHNRLQGTEWSTNWTATVSYRWPSFANASLYYQNREAQVLQPGGDTLRVDAVESWLLTVDWWVTPSTTFAFNYSMRSGKILDGRDLWGLSLSTQF